CASIGSPSVVPVPCASTASTSPGPSRALANACRITRSCDGPFGAVNPLLAPSWLTALPRTTANTRWPRAPASHNRSTTTRPPPPAAPPRRDALAPPIHRQPPPPAEPEEQAGGRHAGAASGQGEGASA